MSETQTLTILIVNDNPVTGRSTAAYLRAPHPVTAFMLTGATEGILAEGARNLGAHGCLVKGHCHAYELDRAIRAAVAQHTVT